MRTTHHPDRQAAMYLTRRQKEILDYIGEYLEARGYAPTLEEIGAHFGLSSPATVYKHVQRLVQKGYLRKTKHQGRGIELVEAQPERSIEVAVRGTLRPGERIEPIRPPELTALPPSFRGRAPLFALRVRGNDLGERHLIDGDLLVLEERSPGRDGETALVIWDGSTPALGRCRHDEGNLLVEAPGNSWRRVASGRDEMRGVLVGVLRRYP